MPRIPTRDSLRQGVPRSAGGIVQAPRDFVGQSLQAVGSAMFDKKAIQREKQQQSALELAKARSQWHSSLLAERAAYTPEQTPDHGNWSKTYQTRAPAWQQQAARTITDPRVRQQFVAETQDDLEQVGLDVDRRAREIGHTVRRAEADEALLQQVNNAASQPDQDSKLTMGGVRATLQDMVQTGLITAEEAAGRSVSYAQHYASLKLAALTKQDPAHVVSVLSGEQPGPAALVRQLEGFRSTPYWHAGTIRAGYGSDTITRENGDVEEIGQGMTVSRADADRDLQRRMDEFRSGINGKADRRVFERLSSNVQAALFSVAYSSGQLPDQISEAVRTGDAEIIASAIEASGEQTDDAGRQRRSKEAAIVRGDAGNAYDQIARRPSWVGVLDPAQRASLLEMANREVERTDNRRTLADRTFALKLGQHIRSDIRSVYSTGAAANIDPGDVLRELGDEKNRQWKEVRQDAEEIRLKTLDMPILPDDAIVRIVNAHRPEPGSGNVEREQAVHDRISRRAHQVMQERTSHPARAAMRVPSVRQALTDAQDPKTSSPEKTQALVHQLQATQKAFGVPKASIAPVPDEWAFEIGRALAKIASGLDGSNTDQAANAVRKVYSQIKEQYGEFSDNVIAYSIGRARTLGSDMDRQVGELVRPMTEDRPLNRIVASGRDTAL